RKREIPLAKEIDPSYVDILRYVDDKRNPSVLISGRPGMGKTELMKLLLVHQKIPKVVFSFKPSDAYLQLPYQLMDISRHTPDPFQDADAFLMAYELAHPVNVRGIMLSEAAAMVKSLAGKSRSWDEFRRNLKNAKRDATDIQKEALALIEGQTESLAVGEGTFRIDLTKDTVLDFSSLGESAKTFYAEIALRQIWESLATGPVAFAQYGRTNVRLLIAMDELHRLMQVYGEFGVKSVIDTLLRMVRQFGGIYAATQNLTDVPDRLRNLFGTQFVFNTSSENDLEAMRKVEPGYAWVAKELGAYRFIDVTFRTAREGLIPVFEAEPVEVAESKAENDTSGVTSQSGAIEVDYSNMVRQKISNGEVVWVSGLARSLEQTDGLDRDIAKLKIRNILRKLLDAGEVQVQRLDDPESGEAVSLYFAKSGEEKVSPLHRFMVKRLLEKLGENGEAVLNVAESGQGAPDVETEAAYYEIETGLKTRTVDLEERISALSATKPFVILVPNSDLAKSDKYGKLNGPRVVVATLAEFIRVGTAPRDS
ncbi:MAG: ATP-binding protein, partial [Nitrososphaerota archaeon]|nr:ATP-binding protein [Nitrososphaerota archaeon]